MKYQKHIIIQDQSNDCSDLQMSFDADRSKYSCPSNPTPITLYKFHSNQHIPHPETSALRSILNHIDASINEKDNQTEEYGENGEDNKTEENGRGQNIKSEGGERAKENQLNAGNVNMKKCKGNPLASSSFKDKKSGGVRGSPKQALTHKGGKE